MFCFIILHLGLWSIVYFYGEVMGFSVCVFFYIKCPIISALFIERTTFS